MDISPAVTTPQKHGDSGGGQIVHDPVAVTGKPVATHFAADVGIGRVDGDVDRADAQAFDACKVSFL